MNRLVALVVLYGCQSQLDAEREPVALDRPYFDCRVQPVLTKYCGQLACHGDPERYFRVYARNRLRDAGGEAEREIFMRPSERDHNYAAASALVDVARPEASLLALKPLDQRAGGAFHVGATLYMRGNVFASPDDPDYQVIVQWITGAMEDPTCQEPGSNL